MKKYFKILLYTVISAILFTSCDLFHTTNTTRGNSYALIYGVADYIGPDPENNIPDNDLEYTYNDAFDMNEYFTQQGFITTPKYNSQATKAAMLADFGSIRDKANAND